MKKIITHFTLPLLALVGITSGISIAQNPSDNAATGTLETLIVANGTVSLDLDMNRLNGTSSKSNRMETLRFQAVADSFFPIVVFNNEFRGPRLGTIALTGHDSPALPASLRESFGRLVVEKVDWNGAYDLVVRDGKTGFVFFNLEGHQYDYDASVRSLQITGGRLLMSEGFAKNLGRAADAGAVVGNFTVAANMRPIEVRQVVNGVDEAATLLPSNAPEAQSPGPDVIVGVIPSMGQFGSTGTRVGLGVGTTSCNIGNVELNWFQMPNTDHPVIPQNLYRMSSTTDRFEQVGQSWLKHAFTALQQNACNLGCQSSGTGTRLGVGCSDPYDAGLNASQSGLGSRAWVNPFTGAYPSTARDHTGHGSHTGVAHRLLVEQSDLSTTLNPGATYFAEAQYVTPHEYAWCQSHPGQCNMYNNASYRQFSVSGTTSFSFTPVGSTVQMTPAINAWTGATVNMIEPEPGVDGRGFVAYKVSGPVGGIYHYEYAVNNQNLDRAIQSFSVPLGCGVAVSNIGFHAPLNEAGSANDGTSASAGISNAAWATNQTANSLTWSSETFAQNPNANAIRWGTLFNFRFDSSSPPVTTNATVGFYKNGSPITVAIQAPSAPCAPLTFASAVSRKTHGGAGTFDIDLPLAGEPGVECRNSGAGDHTFVFTFSNNVVSGAAAVTEGVGTAGSPVFSGNTMTVNLSGVTNLQKVTVSLSSVTDEFAQTMPDTTVSVNMLLGDVIGNKSVNSSDVGQTKALSGVTLDGTNFRADVNASGGVNGSDIGQVKATVGNTLP